MARTSINGVRLVAQGVCLAAPVMSWQGQFTRWGRGQSQSQSDAH